jgi:hypothetical protein
MEPDRSRWHAIQAGTGSEGNPWSLSGYTPSAGVLPPQLWRTLYPELGTRIERRSDGLLLQTGNKSHTDAAAYGPIEIPASGRYGFTLDLTPQSGEIVFGIVSADGATWFAADVSGPEASKTKLECWADLRKGQNVTLRISNRDGQGSKAVLRELRGVEIDSRLATPPQ